MIEVLDCFVSNEVKLGKLDEDEALIDDEKSSRLKTPRSKLSGTGVNLVRKYKNFVYFKRKRTR